MPNKIIVSGVGSCLVDLLYNNDVSFSNESVRPYLLQKRGDGGRARLFGISGRI